MYSFVIVLNISVLILPNSAYLLPLAFVFCVYVCMCMCIQTCPKGHIHSQEL